MRAAWLWGMLLATTLAVPARGATGVAPVTATPPVMADDAPVIGHPTPQFRRYGADDGLPSGSVYAVAQDRNGLMWFATAGGLVRFDGVSFKVFRHDPADADSLPSNQIYALLVDRTNRVWAGGMMTGLSVYDQIHRRFRHWDHDPGKADSLVNDEVWSMAQTGDGRIWVATQGGLERLRTDERGFEHMTLDLPGVAARSFGPTRALFADADGRLWIGTDTGLYVRAADGQTRRVRVDAAFAGDIGKVWHIEGGAGEVRVAVTGGLLVIGADGVARPLAGRELAASRVVSSARDGQGRLWLGTLTGVVMVSADGQLQRITAQPLLPGGLPGDGLAQILRDHEGGLWFVLDQAGIAYLPPRWSGVTRYTHVPDDPGSLHDTAVLAVTRSTDGQLWVGGWSGWVDKLDPRTGAVKSVARHISGSVGAMAEDRQGRLWLTTSGRLLVADHGKLTALDAAHSGMSRPVALIRADDGELYAASWGEGLMAIDTQRMRGTPLLPADQLGDTAYYGALLNHGGRLWYASSGGVQFINDRHQLEFVPGVPHDEALGIGFDPQGGFWTLSTSALTHYRYAGGRATRIDQVDLQSMPFAEDIRSIHVDGSGQVWLFGDPGLWRLDPATRQFTRYGAAQGLSNAGFGNGSIAVLADGSVFAASNGGVMAFVPRQLQAHWQPDAPPRLTLTELAVRRGGSLQALALDGAGIDLQWNDRDLHIGVRLASYLDPAANRYRFWLHGVDSGWVDATGPGQRDFSALPAGSYTLEASAAGADGQWRTLAQPLRITVQAPPWARWWAWTAYVLTTVLVLGALLLAWRRRLNARHRMQLLEQQRHMAEAANAAKTQFLATLSHEIRTPMTGIMGMAELLLGTSLDEVQGDYTRAMQRSGRMLLRLLNDALDLSRIEAGRLELEKAPFNPRQLLDEVIDLERGQARLKGIDLRLQVADDLPPRLLGDMLRIKQVLLNLANNALKFTVVGSVTLGASRTRDGVLFTVSDTGPGIPAASRDRLFQRFEQLAGPQRAAGSGLGLAICRELVNIMGGSIELESAAGAGSTFRVRLPLAELSADAAPAHGGTGPVAPRRILLVEDDVIVAAVIRGMLAAQGHAVCHVVNGLAALAELAQARFDVVLLDLDLPGVDGFQIARMLRQRETAGGRVPILAVTARSGADDEALALAAGMDGFLRKPLTGEQLAASIDQVLATAG